MGDAGPKTKPQKRGNSSPWMPRLRKRGEKLLHSKYVVILVIILTIIDCSLVIAELILDLYSVKKTLSATEDQTFKFIRSIRSKYPEEVRSNDSVFSVYERITHATILWNNSKELDIHLRCSNFGSELTTTNNVGMPFPSESTFESMTNNNKYVFGSNTQTMPIYNGNNLPNRRIRRTQTSNINHDHSKSYQHNDRRIRTNHEDVLRKYFHRVRRYLPTSIQSLSDRIFHNGSSTNENNDYSEDDDHNNYDDSNENEVSRLLDDLVIIHQQISDYFTMQLTRGADQTTVLTAAVSSSKNADGESNIADVGNVNIQSDGFSYDDGSDRSGVGVDVPRGSMYDTVVYSDFSSDDSQDDADAFGDGGVDGGERSSVRGGRKKRDSDDDDEATLRRELHHSKEMEIAHKLHYASVCVVSILVIEVTMKIVCAGSHFLKRKIEVFDAVVIVTSVVVDLIFIKGLSEFAVDDSIFVLALLLPWRVIRVVNSLVMAVIDHEHVKLRLLYSRKKKLDKTVENLRNEVDELKGMMQEIRSFCIKEGIDSSRIDGMLGKFAPRRRKDSRFYTLVKLVMSTASINNNDNESVSSSSIENDLRHIANRDSVLNEVASTDGTMSSLKRYLSVPFSNGDSRSASEADSITGDPANTSPSIYITSPAIDDGCGMFTFCDVEMGEKDVVAYQDSTDCIEEEDSVATLDVTSDTINTNNMNGVAFYVGSQTSFNFGISQGNTDLTEMDKVHNDCIHSSSFSGALSEAASGSSFDANRNIYSNHFGQYLTVPHCTVSVSSGTNTVSISSSNNNNVSNIGGSICASTAIPSLPHGSSNFEMKRSASDNANVALRAFQNEGVFPRILYGSPIPARRLPEIRTKRKNYTRYKSESDDNESVGLLNRDSSGRLRRYSGEPRVTPFSRAEPKRARSHSPSPMTLLSVPGNRVGGEITCSSSRSMNDVSSAGNTNAHTLGGEGKILRRSCLSLTSEGRKRRGKSPHRVSFKVS